MLARLQLELSQQERFLFTAFFMEPFLALWCRNRLSWLGLTVAAQLSNLQRGRGNDKRRARVDADDTSPAILEQRHRPPTYETLVTFVGMDGFG
ncbi:unnamed protein product, partial [Symbiodinium microadriaticum]